MVLKHVPFLIQENAARYALRTTRYLDEFLDTEILSVTELQLSLARPTWKLLTEKLKVDFYHRLSLSAANSPVHVLSLL